MGGPCAPGKMSTSVHVSAAVASRLHYRCVNLSLPLSIYCVWIHLFHLLAAQGPNADFTIQPTTFQIQGPDATAPFDLTTFVRIDGVALEPSEDFVLTLDRRNDAGRAILAPAMPGHFVVPTLRVIIADIESE